MAFDTEEIRASCISVNYIDGTSVKPNSDMDNFSWRQAVGYGYAGFQIQSVGSWRRRRKYISLIRRRRVI